MKFSEFLSEAGQIIPPDTHVGDLYIDGQNVRTLRNKTVPLNIQGTFSCRLNVTTLTGGPKTVTGDYKAGKNLLSNFNGFPEFVGETFWLHRNRFTSLHDIHKTLKECRGGLILDDNPLKSHVLGVLLIKGLRYTRMDDIRVEKIINKYLPNTRGNDGVLDCQNELIDRGYDEYAQL